MSLYNDPDDAQFFELVECMLILGACVLAPLGMIAVCLNWRHTIRQAGLRRFLGVTNKGSIPLLRTPRAESLSPPSKPTLRLLHSDAGHTTASGDFRGADEYRSPSDPLVASNFTSHGSALALEAIDPDPLVEDSRTRAARQK